MISYFFSPVIFHVLFAATVGAVNVKILQINEAPLNTCDGYRCNIVHRSDVNNVVKFVNMKNPHLIFWFSQFKSSETIFRNFNDLILPNMTILPVYDTVEYRNDLGSKLTIFEHHFHGWYSIKSHNIPIIVLNTRLWLSRATNELATNQINWLDDRLREFESTLVKVIVVGYDSPGFLEDNPTDTSKYVNEYNEKVVEILKRYSTSISACVFASRKIDSFRIVLDNDGKPVIPMFIAPTITRNVLSSISSVRLYNYTIEQSIMDNYIQYYRDRAVSDIAIKYNYKAVYNMKNVYVDQLYKFAESFIGNETDNFIKYNHYQIGNLSMPSNCVGYCQRCSLRCFIVSLIDTNLKRCLENCAVINSIGTILAPIGHSHTFNNPYFRIGVIVAFVAILVGIVVAVNKVYCVRLNRHRNAFLTPLPIDFNDHTDIISVQINGKLSLSKENTVSEPTKIINGHKQRLNNNHDPEQTYDYIRM